MKLGKAFFLLYTRSRGAEEAMLKALFRKGKAKSKKVVFQFYAPQAQAVALSGDFNGWDPSKTPLLKEQDGKWKTELDLAPGRYEYRYWVDGDWQNEQSPVECVPNPFGTWNCVLEIH